MSPSSLCVSWTVLLCLKERMASDWKASKAAKKAHIKDDGLGVEGILDCFSVFVVSVSTRRRASASLYTSDIG